MNISSSSRLSLTENTSMHSPKEIYSMTNEELDRALRQLRLGGMADVLAIRAQQARAENLGPLDFIGMLVHDELERRRDRLVSRHIKNAGFRDVKTLDTFDWSFNAGFDRALIFDLATSRFIERHDDVLMLGNAAEDLLEIVIRRYERASTIITSNRPLEDWPRMFGDTPAVTAFLDRLMHHSHLLELRGKSYRLHQSSVTARQRKATDCK